MTNSIGENYKKTIYTLLVNQDYQVKVEYIATSKKKLWQYLNKRFGNYFEQYDPSLYLVETKIGSYSTFTKALDISVLHLRVPTVRYAPSKASLTINTWHV